MAQQDPTLMNATPSKKALLDSINTQVKAQTANEYGYSPYQAVGRLPAQEQDAILGDMANQITYKGGISVTKDDLKQLPVFNAPTISARKPSFLENIADIGANLGEGIIQGVTGRATDYYGNDLHDKFNILGSPNNEWVRNITAIPTGLAVGAGLTLANPLLGAGWFGATSANQAVEGNQLAEQEAIGTGDFNQAQQIKDLRGQSAGLAGLAGGLTSFLPATLGRGLASKVLTGAGLGYAQDAVNEKALEYASTGGFTNKLPSVGLGTVFGGGFPLAGAGLKKLAGKRAKISEAPSQKQAIEALQNEADNAPLASQRNRARATLRRMNTEYLKQPIQTTAKPASKPFKAGLEVPQAVKKPVGIVPVKTKVKPPLKAPAPIVGGLKKKVVTPAEVTKVDVKTEQAQVDFKPKPTHEHTNKQGDKYSLHLEKNAKLTDYQLTALKQGLKHKSNKEYLDLFKIGKATFRFNSSDNNIYKLSKDAIKSGTIGEKIGRFEVSKNKDSKPTISPFLNKPVQDLNVLKVKDIIFFDTYKTKNGDIVKGDSGKISKITNSHIYIEKTPVVGNTYELKLNKAELKKSKQLMLSVKNPEYGNNAIKENLTVQPKPQEMAVKAKVVEPTPAKAESKPPAIEGLKNGDKAPPMKEGESFDDYRARLEKQGEKGMGLRKESLLNGKISWYEKTSKIIAGDKADADIEAFTGKPLKELSNDELLKASEHFRDRAPSPETTKANERIKKLANDAILEADAKGEDTSKLREIEANAIAGLDILTEQGQIISVKDAPTEHELAIKRLKQDGNIDVAKAKAEADAVIKAIDDAEIPVKAINKGTRDISTQLQDLKASQGTQPHTPDDIRRGASVLMGHDSFLAKETLEALGYPLKYKKFSGDANSTGWSVVIGSKKVQLYKGDSLGGLLRRNKLEGAFEAGLVKRKAGDVVKGLIDDLDPNDLTLNETDLKQKLTAYAEGLPKDGGLLTSREAEAFALLDNAKTPEELNAVERYVSERENDYQDGFHDNFYRQWNDRHQALEADYQGKVENRVAKADETRQLKATEELKVLKKQLEIETNKVLKLENEMALLSPTVRLERTLQNDVLRDAKKVAKRLKGGYESGKIDDAQFTRIVEGLSPEAREALAEEFSC